VEAIFVKTLTPALAEGSPVKSRCINPVLYLTRQDAVIKSAILREL
jgi:hypothetical protein